MKKIFADFHSANAQGRLRLNCIGTVEDIARQNIALRDGQLLSFYSEDLEVEGTVQYSSEEKLWVAVIDWSAIEQLDKIVVLNYSTQPDHSF